MSIEPKLLEKSQFLESQKEIAKRDDKVAELQKKLDEITREKKGDPTAATVAAGAAPAPAVPGITAMHNSRANHKRPVPAGQ